MTMDKSLRGRSGMSRLRSVLTRGERIQRLKDADKWNDERSPLGLPKVRVIKLSMKKKKKTKEEAAAAADAGKAGKTAAKPAGKK